MFMLFCLFLMLLMCVLWGLFGLFVKLLGVCWESGCGMWLLYIVGCFMCYCVMMLVMIL